MTAREAWIVLRSPGPSLRWRIEGVYGDRRSALKASELERLGTRWSDVEQYRDGTRFVWRHPDGDVVKVERHEVLP